MNKGKHHTNNFVIIIKGDYKGRIGEKLKNGYILIDDKEIRLPQSYYRKPSFDEMMKTLI